MPRRNAPSKAPPSGASFQLAIPKAPAAPPVPPPPTLPALHLTNRQRAHRLDLRALRALAARALPLCLAEAGPLPQRLADLPEVVISFLSVAAMSRVHREFLALEGPTDVITFPYGEILVCPAVAAGHAARYGQSLADEVALYVIHGLLHLNGYDDLQPAAARQMRARQSKILNAARKSG